VIPLFDVVLGASAGDASLAVAIVAARLLVPLLFGRFPLAILVVLVIDAADQTLLATFTEIDTSETGAYQSVDKALDVYYLALAYLAAMRNWTSDSAFRIAQFLLYYRLLGVALFELTDERALLLIFPNTFEYFFIVYEVARTRYEPSRFSARFWLLLAAGIWVFVKLPQEYWIHVAKLDFTDAVRNNAVFAAAVVLALVVGALVVVRVLVPRLPPSDWAWRLRADPLPSSLVDAHARYARRLASPRVLTHEALEQILLLGLLCVIFASILPGVDATSLQVVIGVTAIVVANAAIDLWAARRGGFGLESAAARYGALLAANLLLVYLANVLLGGRGSFELRYGLFFAFLIATVIWFYEAFRPVYDLRFDGSPLHVRSVGDLFRRARERRP
jgi:hypothetical protein